MLYLIAGRSGAGKDTLANKIVELSADIMDKPMKILQSYATRPKRFEAEKTHIFITEEEAATYTDKVAVTHIGEYEYFATAKQVKNTDIYVIDPKGIEELTKNMPDTEFTIIYMKADEDLNRKIHAVRRAEDKITEEERFTKRDETENEQFTEFEDKIFNKMDDEICFPKNVKSAFIMTNDYTEACLEHHAMMIVADKARFLKMCNIVRECMDLDILKKSENVDDNGEHKIIAKRTIGETITREEHTIEQCASGLLNDATAFRDIIGNYILVSPKF